MAFDWSSNPTGINELTSATQSSGGSFWDKLLGAFSGGFSTNSLISSLFGSNGSSALGILSLFTGDFSLGNVMGLLPMLFPQIAGPLAMIQTVFGIAGLLASLFGGGGTNTPTTTTTTTEPQVSQTCQIAINDASSSLSGAGVAGCSLNVNDPSASVAMCMQCALAQELTDTQYTSITAQCMQIPTKCSEYKPESSDDCGEAIRDIGNRLGSDDVSKVGNMPVGEVCTIPGLGGSVSEGCASAANNCPVGELDKSLDTALESATDNKATGVSEATVESCGCIDPKSVTTDNPCGQDYSLPKELKDAGHCPSPITGTDFLSNADDAANLGFRAKCGDPKLNLCKIPAE